MATVDDKDFDVVFLQGETKDGEGLRALRSRPGRIEATELRAVREGRPLTGELVRLLPREESPLLWNVDVQYSQDEQRGHAGPARITSEAYRDNWERIFGGDVEGGKRTLN